MRSTNSLSLLFGIATYLKHAESRLLQELPQAERSKILRMKAEPQLDEIYEVGTIIRVCAGLARLRIVNCSEQSKQQRAQQGRVSVSYHV